METLKSLVQAPTGAIVALILLTAALAVARPLHAQVVVDRVVASVDGQPITTHDIKVFAAANGTTAPDPNDPNASAETRSVLKALISQALLKQEVKKYADKVDDSQVDDYIQNLERKGNLTDAEMRAQLKQAGTSYAELRKKVRLQLETMTMINDEVRKKINIPPAEIKAYYDAHPGEFTTKQERFKLAQILIAVPENATPAQVEAARDKAESIRKQALAGGNFAMLASKYSDDASKTKGGELGYFQPSDLMDSIHTAVENLKAGQLSPVVRTKFGFHILKVEEHDLPGRKPLAEVSPEILDTLMTEKAKDKFQHWIDSDLTKRHYVEVLN
jgi:peptidyl-prolyl cis-trans isomerase SurA